MNIWRAFRRIGTGVVMLLFSALTFQMVQAQPSPSALADQLDRAYEERIRSIDHLRITTSAFSGMFDGMESTTLYEKVNREGRDVLIEVEEEGLYDGVFQGFVDDIMSGLVRNASSIREDQLEGYSVYRIEVDDQEFLSELQAADAFADEGYEDEDYVIESAILYIDRDELLLRFSSFDQQTPEGQVLTINFELTDYQVHSGFPVPHLMRMEIEGLDQMFSDDELVEAREAMREMQTQLESMPQAQREMIESQLRPQMERFEAMIEQGDLGDIEIRVTDVGINSGAVN